MDVAAIEPGRDFRKAIDDSIATCSVLLVLLGERWLDARDAAGARRLESDNDSVRLEIASALRRDIPVIPVLVRGARMPAADTLPSDLQDFAYRNAVELTHARWRSDIRLLIDAVAPCLGNGSDQAPPRHAGVPADSSPASPIAAVDAVFPAVITTELAHYIGPIAELVVKRAIARGGLAADICDVLANEIDDDVDRRRFVASCRRARTIATVPPAGRAPSPD